MVEVKTLRQSVKARKDIRDILRFTRDNWGGEKMLAYAREMDDTILMLCRHPAAGHTHPELDPALRMFAVGAHLIVYKVSGATMLVVRILHQGMSLKKHL